MNRIGKARNARLNQAMKHILEVRDNLAMLVGARSDKFIQVDDPWADARNALEQAVQCFHEANAYNNAMEILELGRVER